MNMQCMLIKDILVTIDSCKVHAIVHAKYGAFYEMNIFYWWPFQLQSLRSL